MYTCLAALANMRLCMNMCTDALANVRLCLYMHAVALANVRLYRYKCTAALANVPAACATYLLVQARHVRLYHYSTIKCNNVTSKYTHSKC